MASIKTVYVVQSCPLCKKELLRVQQGTKEIGSPLLPCPRCKITFRTDMRVEWCHYELKWFWYLLPLLLAVGMLVVGALMGELAIGIMASFLGLIIGLCMSLAKVPAIVRSKKRMKDPGYLSQLLEYKVLTKAEYDDFMAKAKK